MKRSSDSIPTVATILVIGLSLPNQFSSFAYGQAVPPGQTTEQVTQQDDSKSEQQLDEKSAEIEAWIEQLNESSLTKRRKAKEALVQADAAAIPLLAKAALSDKRELIVYSLEVLGTLAEKSPVEETRKAARITLQMLADSEHPSTAERAKQILSSKSGESIEAFPGWDDPNSGFAGGGGMVNRSVSVSSINGVKTIRIDEAGRVTTFRDEPRGAIRVNIEDGGKKKEFVAKNLDDLKKKDAESHALYEQHSNGVGGEMRTEVFGGFPNLENFGNMGGAAGGANAQANAGGMAFGPGGGIVVNQQAGGMQVAGQGNGAAANSMLIQQLEELKTRLADHPEMLQMLDAQIQQLKRN
ncbi:MAG: hypothetical protein KF851_00935 [Pirellulaceae bacterium]|nr:hypothetical protein [Pirellulaceae bacterium]